MTENTDTEGEPIQRFPDKEYVFTLIKYFEKFDRVLVPKSRQVLVTWTFSAFCLWRALFFGSSIIFIQSKKEEDSARVIDRIALMYQYLPEFIKAMNPVKPTHCKLSFENRSIIVGVPEGVAHLRGATASIIVLDEAAFIDGVSEVLSAAIPALGRYGKLFLVSSAAPSIFKNLVFDID